MKKCCVSIFLITLVLSLGLAGGAFAKVEWEFINNIKIDDKPLDIAVSADGSTAYILCDKKILLYSTRTNKITDTIPVEGKFSQISVAPKGGNLFLADAKGKQVSVLRLSQVFDIPVGKSPIIGKADAPVELFAFLDYQ